MTGRMTGSRIAPIWPKSAPAANCGNSPARNAPLPPGRPKRQPEALKGARLVSSALSAAPEEERPGFHRISVRRLVLIRWVAIAGQAVTLLVVYGGFGF